MSNSGLLQTFFEIRIALHRFLILRGANSAEADDILQDVSLRIASQKVGPVSEARAYLYKMASNQFNLLRRTEERRARREGDWVDAGSAEAREIDPQPSSERTLIEREQLAILEAALDRLPERTRSIFVRFRIDGERQKRIAEELGISVKAIEKHLARAYEEIARIRDLLDGDHTLPRHLSHRKGAI